MAMSLSWSDGLTPEQRLAASHIGSHARLLAGPGTGKTHTIAARIAYLVNEQKVNPSDILVLTFTRLATRQLRSDIARRIGTTTQEMPHISTLHAFALRQLRHNASSAPSLMQPLRIADDWEERHLIQKEMRKLLKWRLQDVRNGFHLLAADWQTLNADKEEYEPDPKFLGAWGTHRRVYGYTLRAELVYQLKKAIEEGYEFSLVPNFRYVLIDEYQDLNPCDLAIAAALARSSMELMACGDDDQSIYGFRHAAPSGIRNFLEVFPGAADLVLTECRRCGSNILRAALWVAEQDIARIEKALRPMVGRPAGEVQILRFRTGDSEAWGIAQLCKKFVNEGTAPGNILILVRSNRNGDFSLPVINELARLGVQVAVNADKETLLEGNPGRRLLSLLRLIANPTDHLAWRSQLALTDGIGDTTFSAIYQYAETKGVGFSGAIMELDQFINTTVPPNSRKRLMDRVTATREALKRFKPVLAEQEASNDTKTTAALKSFVQAVAETEITEEEGRGAVLDYIEEIADASAARTLADLLIAVALGREDREETEATPEENRINILSMHQAKGLTAEIVFVMALEDEVIPRTHDQPTLDDNRRLLYVSMTRAKEKLFMTYAIRRTGKQAFAGRTSGNPVRQISTFLQNIRPRPAPGEAYVQGTINTGSG